MGIRKSKRLIFCVITIFFTCFCGSATADQVDTRILELNKTLKSRNLPWIAGRTTISELSPEAQKKLLGGPMEPVPVDKVTLDFSEEARESQTSYPGGAPPVTAFDWRNRDGINWMTPVTNQMCGDCWAHATCGSMEVRLRWLKGGSYGYQLPINLSERYAVMCSPHASCSPWNVPSILNFIQSDGIPDEECLAYDPALDCGDRCTDWSNRVYKVTNHGTYNGPGTAFTDNVANSCYNYGPIAVWMMVYNDFWDYTSGIYVKSSNVEEGGHFVNIVGWGSSGGVDYWICKNSWGTGWGVNGYFYIRRGTNESRIEEQAYWLTPQALPNLDDSQPAGWDYPIVPRGDTAATAGNVQVSSTLPGNSNNTYWNVSWKNEGTVKARDNVTHLSVDDNYTYWFSISYQPAGYETEHMNYGPSTVRGGRHTICQNTMDFDNRVWEYDESDNTYCRQFIWSPKGLSNNSPVTRSAPPKKDSLGYTWYNNDGFSFHVQQDHPDDWWSAVGVLSSNTGADYDIRVWDIGDYTGSGGGFGGGFLAYSQYGGSACDFVIVNDNKAASGTYYAGVINDNQGTADFRIEADTSEKIFEGANGPYSKSRLNVLDIYECYLSAGTYGFKLEQTFGTCDLGMTLYDDGTTHCKKSDYMAGGYANSNGDGENEYMQVTVPNPGFHGLVVWKADASDYAKLSTYKIKMGKCATPGPLMYPSPINGATNVSVDTDLDWDDCDNTERYEVWLREGSNPYILQGITETSSWTLPTLNADTTYQWFVQAYNICGSTVVSDWSFTTEKEFITSPWLLLLLLDD